MTKCGNCGAEMYEAQKRDGMKIYICPHVKHNAVRKISHVLAYPEIWCEAQARTQARARVYSEEPSAKLYAKTVTLQKAFVTLISKSNSKFLTIESFVSATYGTIPKTKLYEYVNIALMLDLEASELPNLFNSAIKLGYAMGTTAQYAIESLTKGIGRESKKILDNIGITFKWLEALQWFKTENNIRHALTGEQRKNAWRAFACVKIIEKAKALSVDHTIIKQARIDAQRINSTVEYGEKLVS